MHTNRGTNSKRKIIHETAHTVLSKLLRPVDQVPHSKRKDSGHQIVASFLVPSILSPLLSDMRILFLWAFSRRLVAQEETSNRHQCWSNNCQRKGEGQSEASASPSTKRPTVETRRNTRRLRKVVLSTSFRPSTNSKNTTNTKAHNGKEGTPSFRRRHKKFKQTNYSSHQALY